MKVTVEWKLCQIFKKEVPVAQSSDLLKWIFSQLTVTVQRWDAAAKGGYSWLELKEKSETGNEKIKLSDMNPKTINKLV